MTAVRTESRLLIAFLGLSGFTAQGTRVSDSELADTLDDFFALAAGTIEDAGGTVVKFISCRIANGIAASSCAYTMGPNVPAAQISSEAGGAFVLFGGQILDRHIELVPNQRIVQAWRAADWDAGMFSIARFDLREQGGGTKLVFDHTGFPAGGGAHLATGWHEHYREPLKKYLA